jgi:hypothetical protein
LAFVDFRKQSSEQYRQFRAVPEAARRTIGTEVARAVPDATYTTALLLFLVLPAGLAGAGCARGVMGGSSPHGVLRQERSVPFFAPSNGALSHTPPQ